MLLVSRSAFGWMVMLAASTAACEDSSISRDAGLDGSMHAADATPPLADAWPPAVDSGGRISPSCPAGAPSVDLAALRAESIARARSLVHASEGLDDGQLYFVERVTRADECPFFDQTAILYVLPGINASLMPPAGLPQLPGTDEYGEGWGLAIGWGLNGLATITYVNIAAGDGIGVAQGQRFPFEVLVAFPSDMSETRRDEIRDALMNEFPPVPGALDYLDFSELGVLGIDVESARWETLTGSTAERDGLERLRAIVERLLTFSDLPRENIELSHINYRFPIVDAEPYAAPLESTGVVTPECLRTFSAYNRDFPGAFVSLPSLPAPFGDGWRDNPSLECDNACFPLDPDPQCWSDAQP